MRPRRKKQLDKQWYKRPIHPNTLDRLEAFVSELVNKTNQESYEQLSRRYRLEESTPFKEKARPLSEESHERLSTPSEEDKSIAKEDISEQLEEFVRWELFQ